MKIFNRFADTTKTQALKELKENIDKGHPLLLVMVVPDKKGESKIRITIRKDYEIFKALFQYAKTGKMLRYTMNFTQRCRAIFDMFEQEIEKLSKQN